MSGKAIAGAVALFGCRPMAIFSFRIIRTYFCRYESLVSLCAFWLIWIYIRWLTERYKPYMNGKRLNLALSTPSKPAYKTRFGLLRKQTGDVWNMSKSNFAYYAARGPRPYMEDRMSILSDPFNTNITIYGLFDGHGGELVSDSIEKLLNNFIVNRVLSEKSSIDWHGLLSEEIVRLDQHIMRKLGLRKTYITGSTLLVAVLHESRYLTVAGVGDSRVILCDNNNKAKQVTIDHKPTSAMEKKRIESAGGFIAFNGVWRVAGILATSRALGDAYLKRLGFLTAKPDVVTIDLLNERPKFMVMASDGLWDVVNNQEVIDIIRGHDSMLEAAKTLVQTAILRNSMDNVSILIVKLPGAIM